MPTLDTSPRLSRGATRLAARTARLMTAAAAGLALLALLAGVPYALTRWLGWPLPTDWPSRIQWHNTLTHPLTDHMLLNALACMCWGTWALFATDVVRALPDTIKRAAPPSTRSRRASPLRTAATVLLAALIAGMLATRTNTTALVARHGSPAITPAAPATATSLQQPNYVTTPAPGVSSSETITLVQPPRDGIHDSLWRIAERALGDGNRWPEIFALNLNRPQPDGDTMTSPSLVKPGWTLLLPTSPTKPQPAAPTAAAAPVPLTTPTATTPTPSPEPPSNPPAHTPTSARQPSPDPPASAPAQTVAAAAAPSPPAHGGLDLDDGAYVSAALAAAVSTGLLARRRRNRRSYLPGSGRRDDLLPVAPIIRSLHLAHLRATDPAEERADTQHTDDADDQEDDRSRPPVVTSTVAPLADPRSSASAPYEAPQHTSPPNDTPSGAVLRLAQRGGIGLIGSGAPHAARALLLERIVGSPGRATAAVLITAATLAELLPNPRGSLQIPHHVHVVADLDTALEQLEMITLHRARSTASNVVDTRPLKAIEAITLFADARVDTARLQSILDNGTAIGIGAVLLGQWRPGATAHVDPAGYVSATNPAAARALHGSRLSTISATDALELLRVITDPVTLDQPTESALPTATSPSSRTHENDDDCASTGLYLDGPIAADEPGGHGDPFPVPLQFRVLGPPRLTWTDPRTTEELPIPLGPRQRELLVLLALHPGGISRDRIADTLWPDAAPERPFNALHTALTRLRRSVTSATRAMVTEVTRSDGDRYQLDPRAIDTDYRALAEAIAARRAASTDEDRLLSSRRIIAAYQSELGDGINAGWLEVPRETIRRDALDAASLVAQRVLDDDPQQALDVYEAAQRIDPYNEQIYRDMIAVQARLAQPDAIHRTLALLTTRLAEIDEEPDPETLTLAAHLRREATATNPSSGARTDATTAAAAIR